MKYITLFLLLVITFLGQAQVTVNNLMNGHNPIVAIDDGVSSVRINVFTAGGGCDGLIAVSVGYTQAQPTNDGINSIHFSSTLLTKGVSESQLVNGVYEFSEIWYAPIGTSVGINSFVDVQFSEISSAIVISVSSYHNVDQLNPIGNTETNFGTGNMSEIELNTSARNGIIDNIYSSGNNSITKGAGQTEISNTTNGNVNGNSFKLSTGNMVQMSWTKTNSSFTHVAMEFNESVNTSSINEVTLNDLMNGNNPIVVTDDAVSAVRINVFTAGGGCDGLIAVSLGYTQTQAPSQPVNSGITSIQFSSTFLTKGVSESQLVNGVYEFSEIWYAPIGTNVGINSFVDVQFAAISSTIIISVSSFHNVDQSNPIGNIKTNTGTGSASQIFIQSNDKNGIIDNLYASGNHSITIGGNQTEISNEIDGNTNGNSFSLTSCSTNSVMEWALPNNSTFTHVGMELNHGSCPTYPAYSTIISNPSNLDTMSASNTLSTQGNIIIADGISVVFRAGKSVILKEGFIVKKDSEFHAYIEGLNEEEMSSIIQIDKLFTKNLVNSSLVRTNKNRLEGLIYPNPTNGQFTIKGVKVSHAKIIDIFGRVVLEQFVQENSINISQLPNGIYAISFLESGITYTEQLVKL